MSVKNIPFRRVSVLPSQLPIHISALHCYVNVILLANQSGPLFSGVRFPPFSSPTSCINKLLQGTGVIQSHYSSHHFCIAAAMTAAAAILSATLIKALSYWKSVSYETCVQLPPSLLHAVLSILACTNISTQPVWNPDDPIS